MFERFTANLKEKRKKIGNGNGKGVYLETFRHMMTPGIMIVILDSTSNDTDDGSECCQCILNPHINILLDH
jgi:hypothetical protein